MGRLVNHLRHQWRIAHECGRCYGSGLVAVEAGETVYPVVCAACLGSGRR